jgi:hypothetical protein
MVNEMSLGTEPPSKLGQPLSASEPQPLPPGYRSGIITAITVVLGFSLLFLRSWFFELPGEWTPLSLVAAAVLVIAIVLELVALWRSLQPKDEFTREYAITLRWFLSSAVTLLISLLIAGIAYSSVKDS